MGVDGSFNAWRLKSTLTKQDYLDLKKQVCMWLELAHSGSCFYDDARSAGWRKQIAVKDAHLAYFQAPEKKLEEMSYRDGCLISRRLQNVY